MNLRDILRFKRNVNPAGAHPMLVSGIATCAAVIHELTRKLCYITSMCDGVHNSNSFHYVLMAVDLRSKHLTFEEKDEVLREMRRRLGDGWDVILEMRGGLHEHFHVEWDDGREHAEPYLKSLQEEFFRKLEDVA